MVSLVLAQRLDLNLLKLAVGEGSLPLVRRILRSKRLPLAVQDPDNGWPVVLFYAIAWHQNDVVEYFIDAIGPAEASQPSKDFQDTTALMVAIENNNEVAFSLYLNKFPESIRYTNKSGKTALIVATEKGVLSMIKALLAVGAEVNTTDSDGSTPLHHAAAYGHTDCVNILLECGANPSLVNKKGWTPIDYAYSNELKLFLEGRAEPK